MSKKLLVTGGAGYIGSHVCKALVLMGHEVDIIDNLSTGFKHSIRYGNWIDIDLLDYVKLEAVLNKKKYDCVFHFASFIEVAESVKEPNKYYLNNFIGSLNLINAMRSTNQDNLIFSSTAAIYGQTQDEIKLTEDRPLRPVNPYGKSKLMVEEMLEDAYRAYGLSSVRLRYFNAAGADSDMELGENHYPESHLIPIIGQYLAGRRHEFYLYGDDYKTKDGSCVRDYIHVEDLVDAHIKSWGYLVKNKGTVAINLGSGVGYSVKEIIDIVNELATHNWKNTAKINPIVKDRRSGDSATLIADIQLAEELLDWKPQKTLRDILISSIDWELRKVLNDDLLPENNNLI